MKRILALLITGAVTAPVAAQTYFYSPSNTPSTGTCNVIPFGTLKTSTTWANQRYQQLVLAADLGNGIVPLQICSLAWAACGTQTRSFDSLRITLAQTDATTLSTTFASNLTNNPKVVFDGKCHIWQTMPDGWADVGLQQSYLMNPTRGKNLVIEVIAIGNDRLSGTGAGFHRTNDRLRAYNFGWTGPTPPATASNASSQAALKVRIGVRQGSIGSFGKPCNGTLKCNATGTPKVGGTVTFTLSGGPTTGLGFLWLSLNGLYPSPIDISSLVGTGCKLGVDIQLLIPAPFTNGTTRPAVLPIPNDTVFVCFQLGVQGLGPGSPVPISDWIRVLIGA